MAPKRRRNGRETKSSRSSHPAAAKRQNTGAHHLEHLPRFHGERHGATRGVGLAGDQEEGPDGEDERQESEVTGKGIELGREDRGEDLGQQVGAEPPGEEEGDRGEDQIGGPHPVGDESRLAPSA